MIKLNVDQALLKAKSLAKNGEIKKSLELYKLVLQKFPKDKRAKQGISFLTKQKSHSNTNSPPQEKINQLVNLYNQGQLSSVVEKALYLIKQYPTAHIVWNILGGAYRGLGRTSEALKAFNKAISIIPDYADAYYNKATTLKDQGKLEAAEKSYIKTLSIKPNFADAYNNMGIVLKDKGSLERAIEAFKKAISIKPDYAEAYNNMGNALIFQGKLDDALKANQKSISINPNNAKTYSNMGVILKEQGKLDKAIEAYKKALFISPNYVKSYNNIGVIFQEQGKLDEAIETYKTALNINYDYDDLIENFLYLETQLVNSEIINYKLKNISNKQLKRLIEKPKFQILKAVNFFIKADYYSTQEHINNFNRSDKKLYDSLERKDKIFCTAYANFLIKLINQPLRKTVLKTNNLIYHIGESHCLSFAHQVIRIKSKYYKILPKIIFGAKAFHFSRKVNDQYKAITKAHVQNITKCSNVFLSFGEIDCRPNEGFITASEKLNIPIETLISNTVKGYLNWFADLNKKKNHNLFFFNVPAPIYNKKYSEEINIKVSKTIKLFNLSLEKNISYFGFNIIDVFKFTVGRDGFSNAIFHIDDRHLSSKAITEIEKQKNYLIK